MIPVQFFAQAVDVYVYRARPGIAVQAPDSLIQGLAVEQLPPGTDKGQQPFCVHHCLAGVMQWGTVEDLAKELEEKPNQVLFVPKPYQY